MQINMYIQYIVNIYMFMYMYLFTTSNMYMFSRLTYKQMPYTSYVHTYEYKYILNIYKG